MRSEVYYANSAILKNANAGVISSIPMREINATATDVVYAFSAIPTQRRAAVLDSSGVGYLGSHLLIAAADPVDVFELKAGGQEGLAELMEFVTGGGASIFTLAYEFGATLQPKPVHLPSLSNEPYAYAARYDTLVVHDYSSGETYLTGNESRYEELESVLQATVSTATELPDARSVRSSFIKDEYVSAVEQIREYIRSGDTYQANLTQQFAIEFEAAVPPGEVFTRLRRQNPSAFAAFIQRGDTAVVSSSPERFFRIEGDWITVAPIKGTIRRGTTPEEDVALRKSLAESAKDRAENTMIVDLLRNDLGRICEFGSVAVDELCAVEEHSTLFHLVSTVRGKLRPGTGLGEVLLSLFPSGSITGAPKVRTMQIIGEIEPIARGISMGSIGIVVPGDEFKPLGPFIDSNVAIRTVTIEGSEARFNVGGGVVIDSDPESEYRESLLKAKALLQALGVK
ncbi:MAG: aminodeoxychorismate synthase component I [Acidobacteria bacterium]|nr:aminodeoxychorismate synthase component I [Acidobacteriota bacterium]